MSKQDYDGERGPSWYDVENMMNEVQNAHYCELCYVVRVYRDNEGKLRLTISGVALEPGNIKFNSIRQQRAIRWDRREFKTVTAALYNIALGIDNDLTRAREEAERQASF